MSFKVPSNPNQSVMDEGQPGSKAPCPQGPFPPPLPPSFLDESFDEDCFDEEAYYAALGTRPALNMDELDQSYQHMIDLFSVCTSEDPTTRPSATAIVEALEASLPQE